MNLILRDIDSHIVDKIDKLAKEKNISRNEFLKQKIDEFAFEKEANELEYNYQKLQKEIVENIRLHTEALCNFTDNFIIDFEDAYILDINYKDREKNIPLTNKVIDYKDSEKSDMLIRSIPIEVINRIDELSEQKNISRNEFLNRYLRQLTYSNYVKLVDEKYNNLIEKTLGILDISNRVFKIFCDENIIDISRFYNSEKEIEND
ncbi:MAG: hypothetical protein ACLUUE_04735 [Romboutsia timonensis]|jgi:predicted DNA binding CopG/RHH family protein